VINIETNARGMGSKMIDIQKILVADHVQQLERDATPQAGQRRAPRAFAREADGHGRRLISPTVRLRLGRWLVGVGETIAGPAMPAGDDTRTSIPNAA